MRFWCVFLALHHCNILNNIPIIIRQYKYDSTFEFFFRQIIDISISYWNCIWYIFRIIGRLLLKYEWSQLVQRIWFHQKTSNNFVYIWCMYNLFLSTIKNELHPLFIGLFTNISYFAKKKIKLRAVDTTDWKTVVKFYTHAHLTLHELRM